ncbi:MAG: hypothetical protein JWQ08_995 [Deinococcus sp.]|nr:hypothetical protein [Deinococcus sp.]
MKFPTFPLLTLMLWAGSLAAAQPGVALAPPTAGPSASVQLPAFVALPSRAFLAYANHPNVQRRLRQVAAGPPTTLSADLARRITTDTLTLIRTRKLNPVRAARALALVLVTVSDAQTITSASGRALNSDAVAAIAAQRLQSYLFPQDVAGLNQALQQQLAALPHGPDEWAVAGVIADCVLLFARADHADRPAATRPQSLSEGKWQALAGQQALEMNWGWVSPMATGAVTLPQVTPPPAWNAPEFAADRAKFAGLQTQLTDADRALARHWAAGAGTVTPAGMWLEQASSLTRQHALTGPDTARVLALTAVSGHDAFIACWRAKFQYNVPGHRTGCQVNRLTLPGGNR